MVTDHADDWLNLKCDHCPERAVVVAPGTAERRDLFLLQRGIPERKWCMACALKAGFPFLGGADAARKGIKP